MAKRSSDPRVVYPEVKVQVRDVVRVVGMVAPFAPQGKIRFIEQKRVNGHRRPVPEAPAAVRHGRAKKSSGRDHEWVVEGSCGYRVRGSVFGEN